MLWLTNTNQWFPSFKTSQAIVNSVNWRSPSFLLFSQQNTPNPCGLSWLTLTFLTFHGPMVSSDLSWFFQVLHPGLLLVAPMRAVVALEVRLTWWTGLEFGQPLKPFFWYQKGRGFWYEPTEVYYLLGYPTWSVLSFKPNKLFITRFHFKTCTLHCIGS